jgi:hypothetical protein
MNYLPGLASNRDLPDLCLLSSWDYRREPLGLSRTHCLIQCDPIFHESLWSPSVTGKVEEPYLLSLFYSFPIYFTTFTWVVAMFPHT